MRALLRAARAESAAAARRFTPAQLHLLRELYVQYMSIPQLRIRRSDLALFRSRFEALLQSFL